MLLSVALHVASHTITAGKSTYPVGIAGRAGACCLTGMERRGAPRELLPLLRGMIGEGALLTALADQLIITLRRVALLPT